MQHEETRSSDMGSVGTGHSHHDKQIVSGPPLTVGGGLLKWYQVAPLAEPVAPEIDAMARAFVEAETASGTLLLQGCRGFAILHRCGGGFHFLLPAIWRNGNELWESVYAKDGLETPGFSLFPLPGPNRATFCVWELRAVWHEQQAWRRYLMSARDRAATEAWLDDTYAGPC